MRRTLGFVAIPATFCAGAIAARALLQSAPHSIAIDRAQPLLVVTAWATYGTKALAILLAAIAGASLALAFTVRALDTDALASEGRGLRIVVAIGAASALACLAWPFVFSSDVYAYAAYGDLALRGLSPFAPAPASASDALLDGARWQWNGAFPPCVYGPGFVAFAAAAVELARVAAFDAGATLGALRALAVLAYLATIACADRTLASFGFAERARTRLLALGALNPVVIWSVAEGHNDIYALLIAAAVAAATPRGRRDRILGYGLPLAVCVKASAALALAPFALEPLLRRRRPPGTVVAATIAGTLLAAAIDVPFLWGTGRRIAATGRFLPSVSLPQAIGLPAALVIALTLTAVAARALWCGRRSGYAWLGLAAFAGLPNPYPWYGIILVPLAIAGGRTPAAAGLYAVTICAAIRYLPDAFGEMSPGNALAASAAIAAPLVFALTGLARDLQPIKESRTT